MKRLTKNNKGQINAGLVTGLVFGIASLVIGIIIAFTVVSTIKDANLLVEGRPSATITNETGWINTSGYTLGAESVENVATGTESITAIWGNTPQQAQEYNYSIGLANATISSSGVVTNLTEFNTTILGNVTFTYTYSNLTNEEISTNRISGNFSGGVDKVSDKIPTVLLVAIIVLILGVLAILVGVWQRMRFGGGSTL